MIGLSKKTIIRLTGNELELLITNEEPMLCRWNKLVRNITWRKSSLKLLYHHEPHVSKANTNGNVVDVAPEFSPMKTMEALEEDYEDGNGKNESRQFIEGLIDLE
ncbi:hypothetical protein HKD37_18G051070 [Glycine soja]